MEWYEYRPVKAPDFLSKDLMVAWIKESLIYRKLAAADQPDFLDLFETVEEWHEQKQEYRDILAASQKEFS